MGSDFSLDNMTVADKLNAMERLWEPLRDTPDNVPSPDWHLEILEERERRLANGQATASSLQDVRNRLENLGK